MLETNIPLEIEPLKKNWLSVVTAFTSLLLRA
jgi:hypothetical protein